MKARGTQADALLDRAFKTLGLDRSAPALVYSRIEAVVAQLEKFNVRKKITAGTTGTISERLCEFGLESIRSSFGNAEFRGFGKDWEWVGDFLVPGHPYDIAVSVKSFAARERLLGSGTGSLLTPTLGWGLFKDSDEWTVDRVHSYPYRGFVGIYMPAATLRNLSPSSKKVLNLNGRRLLRDIAKFPADLKGAIIPRLGRVDARKL
jgi:hypothetical protein